MVIPLKANYAISMIKSGDNKVSMHLIHVFEDFMEYIEATEFYDHKPNSGTWLEEADEQFPYANPLKTNNCVEIHDFIVEGLKWADRKVQSKF